MTEPATNIETIAACSIPCDSDCDAVCHADYDPVHKKEHWPWDCPAADRYDWGHPFVRDAIGRLRKERDRARMELSESQRWFDALVTTDKAKQGAPDWMLNRLRGDGKIDNGTYNLLCGLLRDQGDAKMGLCHPKDWAPLADRRGKALAELAELQSELGVINAEWGVRWPDGGAEKMLGEGEARWMVRREPALTLRRRLVGEWQDYKREKS